MTMEHSNRTYDVLSDDYYHIPRNSSTWQFEYTDNILQLFRSTSRGKTISRHDIGSLDNKTITQYCFLRSQHTKNPIKDMYEKLYSEQHGNHGNHREHSNTNIDDITEFLSLIHIDGTSHDNIPLHPNCNNDWLFNCNWSMILQQQTTIVHDQGLHNNHMNACLIIRQIAYNAMNNPEILHWLHKTWNNTMLLRDWINDVINTELLDDNKLFQLLCRMLMYRSIDCQVVTHSELHHDNIYIPYSIGMFYLHCYYNHVTHEVNEGWKILDYSHLNYSAIQIIAPSVFKDTYHINIIIIINNIWFTCYVPSEIVARLYHERLTGGYTSMIHDILTSYRLHHSHMGPSGPQEEVTTELLLKLSTERANNKRVQRASMYESSESVESSEVNVMNETRDVTCLSPYWSIGIINLVKSQNIPLPLLVMATELLLVYEQQSNLNIIPLSIPIIELYQLTPLYTKDNNFTPSSNLRLQSPIQVHETIYDYLWVQRDRIDIVTDHDSSIRHDSIMLDEMLHLAPVVDMYRLIHAISLTTVEY